MYYLTTCVGATTFFGALALAFFLLSTKTKLKNQVLITDFLAVNSAALFLVLSSQQGYASGAYGTGGNLEKVLLLGATLVFLVVYAFSKLVPATHVSYSAPSLLKVCSFVFFLSVSLSASSLLDATVILEFMNVAMLLYFLQSLGAVRPSKEVSAGGFSSSYDSSRAKYGLNATATIFFTMFFIAIFFFTFLTLMLFLTFGEADYYAIARFSTMGNLGSHFFFFFIVLALKIGGAPLHLWKLEAFSSLGFGYLLYYSVVYLFFFFSILYSLFIKLNFYFAPEFLTLGCLVLLSNLVFVALNTYAVVEVRHFVVLSTLLNSTFFLLSIFLVFETGVNFYVLFFANYVVTSLLLFVFFTFGSTPVKFTSRLRASGNTSVNNFLLILPLVSLSGAAPMVGFLIKLMLLVSCAGKQYSLLFTLIIFSIILTLTFYFQIFKNFFFPSDLGTRALGSPAAAYLLATAAVVLAVAPLGIGSLVYFTGAVAHPGAL